ncbi:hypothetical protein [uncultured Fibrobacter sp.]|uniref:hypothetical protein n=1 Tax=uncultured Fibrobacter sp. TaxID=261512 RepID=UPI00262184F8|nr:hypothetical protein [uncultured Fibrobacter sp.]
MKNTLKYVSAFAVAGALVACDSSTSSDGGSPYGDLKYTAPVKQGNVTGRCDVYATSSSVTMIASAEEFGSTFRAEESGTWNADGSYYVLVDYRMSGLFLMEVDDVCKNMKDRFGADYVVCSEDRVVTDRSIPKDAARPLDGELIQEMVEGLTKRCDNFRENMQEVADKFSESPGDVSAERAVSCDVDVAGNIVTQKIVFPSRTVTVVGEYRGDYITITESYTGVDAATLQAVCDTYKSDAESVNVVCDGATITSTELTEGAPLESIVSFYRDGLCPAFLSGNLTLEELWFEDFE